MPSVEQPRDALTRFTGADVCTKGSAASSHAAGHTVSHRSLLLAPGFFQSDVLCSLSC